MWQNFWHIWQYMLHICMCINCWMKSALLSYIFISNLSFCTTNCKAARENKSNSLKLKSVIHLYDTTMTR
jgi:hypothetical protein